MKPEIGKYGEKIRIYNHYTDKHRVLKVRTLCDLFNDMAEMHTFQQEADVVRLNAAGLTWMLRRIHLFVPDMPRWEEQVVFETWNPALDGLLVPRVYKVSDLDSETAQLYATSHNIVTPVQGKLRAFAHTDWMLINLQNRRPERPTDLMRSIAGEYAEELPYSPSLFSRAEHKGRIEMQAQGEALQVRANYSDIDFNGHVTQSAYIQWMLDAHSFDFMDRSRLCELEVIYAHELKPETTAQVRWCFEPDAGLFAREGRVATYTISNEDGSLLHAWGRAVWN